MKLQGNITEVQSQLEAFISIFDKDAKIADIDEVLSLYALLKGRQLKKIEAA